MNDRWPDSPAPRETQLRPKALWTCRVRTSISHHDIVAATVYDDRATQEFIEDYGYSNRSFIASLVVGD